MSIPFSKLMRVSVMLAACLLPVSCALNFSGACRAKHSSITHWQQAQDQPAIYQLDGRYWVAVQKSIYKPRVEVVYDLIGGSTDAKWFAEPESWYLQKRHELFVQLPQAAHPDKALQQLSTQLKPRPKTLTREAFMALGPKLVKGSAARYSKSEKSPKSLYLAKVSSMQYGTPDSLTVANRFPQLQQHPNGRLDYFQRKNPGPLTNLRAGVGFVAIDMPYQIVFYSAAAAITVPVLVIQGSISGTQRLFRANAPQQKTPPEANAQQRKAAGAKPSSSNTAKHSKNN